MNDARRHVRSALALAAEDPTLAVAACHDAIRKPSPGTWPPPGCVHEGAHRIVLEYARHELAA